MRTSRRPSRRLAVLATAAVLTACSGAPSPARTPQTGQPSASPFSPAAPTPPSRETDWTTYAHDPARTAAAAGGPPATSPHVLWRSVPLDGAVYAQPLVVGNRVLVATENDSVYALAVSTGKILWRTHLGAPVPGARLPCGNIDPSGITSTPVADPDGGTVYAVPFLAPGHHELVALDISSGRVRFRRVVDPPGSDPLVEQQRAALSLGHGRVYVAFGGLYGDCGPYHGWVVSLPASGRGPLGSYRVPTQLRGGIWAPGGASLGSDGDLYLATGNSSSTSRFDLGDAVIRLSPGLALRGFFAPANWAELNRDDLDLGSVGPVPVPGGLVFQIGKQGVGYLLRAEHLGGIGGQVFSGKVCAGAFGATARRGSLVYVPCVDGLVALRLRGRSFSIAWRSPAFDSGPPVVAGGAVWALDLADGVLEAFRADTGRPFARLRVGAVAHFAAPAVAGGEIFLVAGGRVLALSGP